MSLCEPEFSGFMVPYKVYSCEVFCSFSRKDFKKNLDDIHLICLSQPAMVCRFS